MASRTLDSTCLCGSTAHKLTLPAGSLPLKHTFCHCNSCRHFTGTLNLTVAVLPESYSPSTEFSSKLRIYDFSSRIAAYSCPT